MTRTPEEAPKPQGAARLYVAPSRYRTRKTILNDALPYLAISPTVVTFAVLLGIPLVVLFATSMQKFGLFELLLEKLNKWVRLIRTGTMILAWAMPVVTGVVLFQWLFDSKLGVVNWAISSTGIFGDYLNHSWFATGDRK